MVYNYISIRGLAEREKKLRKKKKPSSKDRGGPRIILLPLSHIFTLVIYWMSASGLAIGLRKGKDTVLVLSSSDLNRQL